MRIAYISSEAAPFSKTGGLGDVAGALPSALAELGHEISVFTPYYRATRKIDPKAEPVASGAVPVGTEMVPWIAHRASLPMGNAKYYLIANERYFDREGIYGNAQGDYQDSCSRFIFFCRAALAAAQELKQPIDVYHANDWQSALVPVYLRLSFAAHPFFQDAASLMTIHNLSYQGLFWHWDWPLLNLPWKHFNWRELEFHGKMNLLKGSLIYSDVLTTVSPTYAREIQTAELGFGLEGVLGDRKEDLFGVVNGIDPLAWNPEKDPLLPASYSAASPAGKAQCRAALLKRFELTDDGKVPVLGMISRLIEQKGFDLVADAFEDLARRDVKIVVLGTGLEKYHKLLQQMRARFPQKVAVAFAFDNALAHLIEAGSDLFLMPSRFEPCGLSQLYALRYGAVPVVHSVGGLADTVVDATPQALKNGTATGFAFSQYNPRAMMDCIDRALKLYAGDPKAWRELQLRGMRQDWSWAKSAQAYVALYERAKAKAATRANPKP